MTKEELIEKVSAADQVALHKYQAIVHKAEEELAAAWKVNSMEYEEELKKIGVDDATGNNAQEGV